MLKRIMKVPVWEKEEMRGYFYNYLKELSEFDKNIKFDEFNNPIYKHFSAYWQESSRYPFYFLVDEKIAGIALFRKLKNKRYQIAEFYVLPQYRKNNNALEFAIALVNLFEGIIEFSCLKYNKKGIRFWSEFASRFNNPKVEEDKEKITWFIENTKPKKKKHIKG